MSNDDQHQYKDRYMLRFPDGMRDRIKAVAASNNRSMNAEIVATLEEAYPPRQQIGVGWRAFRMIHRMNGAMRDAFEQEMTEYWLAMEDEVNAIAIINDMHAQRQALEKAEAARGRALNEDELDAVIDAFYGRSIT